MADVPSPNVQAQATTDPSGSLDALPSTPTVSPLGVGVKAAVGFWFGAAAGDTCLLAPAVAPLSSFTVSSAVYVPAA